MAQLTPYLSFNGNCREAMSFYENCLGGSLMLQSVEESSMASQWPAEAQKHILHASLISKDLMLFGSDMGGAETPVQGNVISLSLTCNSLAEITSFFESLSQGGQVIHPLHRFFDGTIASLKDKYGLNWILKF